MLDQNSALITTFLIIISAILAQFLFNKIRQRLRQLIQQDHPLGPLFRGGLHWIYLFFSAVIWLGTFFGVLGTYPETRFISVHLLTIFLGGISSLQQFFFTPIIPGITKLTAFQFFKAIIFIIFIGLFARGARKLLLNHILNKTPMDLSIRHVVATCTQYLVILIGVLILLQTAGIDLSALGLVSAAIGVGVGFGLQNIAHNLISGVFILFERPIKVGDRIEVGEVNGDVVRIAARGTTVKTNDNIDIIVPNSSFTSFNVINWSHGDHKVRFRVPVPVAYSSDIRLVEKLLLEVADENENILKNPVPRVIFQAFGDHSIKFELRIWTSKMLHRRGVLFGQINFSIYEKFQKHRIQIPFPQRDLHLKELPKNWQTILDNTVKSEDSLPKADEQKP